MRFGGSPLVAGRSIRSAVYVVSLLVLLCAAAQAEPERKCSGPVCITVNKLASAADVYVSVTEPAPVTITFDITTTNAVTDVPARHTAVFSGSRPVRAFSVRRGRASGAWRYRYRYRWAWGGTNVRHDDRHSYRLPYDRRARYKVSQGFNGSFTHHGDGAYAIDFQMPEGTPVRAARGGLVVHVVDHYTAGGNDPALRSKANEVKVIHADGTVGHYLHFAPKKIVVRPGDRVREGDLLGHAGRTGYARGPHLHFEVHRRVDADRRITFPIRFTTADGRHQILRAGGVYRAP